MSPPELTDGDLRHVHLRAAVLYLADLLEDERSSTASLLEHATYVARMHEALGSPDPDLTRGLRRLTFELQLGLPELTRYALELRLTAGRLPAPNLPRPHA